MSTKHTVAFTPENVQRRLAEMGIIDPKQSPEIEDILQRFLMGGLLLVRDEPDDCVSVFCIPAK